MKKSRIEKHEFTCCICKKRIKGWGNNPSPIIDDEDAECCDICNSDVVFPARMRELIKEKNDEKI